MLFISTHWGILDQTNKNVKLVTKLLSAATQINNPVCCCFAQSWMCFHTLGKLLENLLPGLVHKSEPALLIVMANNLTTNLQQLYRKHYWKGRQLLFPRFKQHSFPLWNRHLTLSPQKYWATKRNLTAVECSFFSWSLLARLFSFIEWIFSLLYTWFGSRIFTLCASPVSNSGGNYNTEPRSVNTRT